MIKPTFQEFTVGDLFQVRQGSSQYTRHYVRNHVGPYPVYSATTDDESIYAFIDSYHYDGDVLTWVRSGYAGRVALRSGKFSVNGDAGVLLPWEKYKEAVFLPYFVPVLTRAFMALAVGRYKSDGASDYTKVSMRNLRTAKVAVPVDEAGAPDLESQREIAGRYTTIQRVKKDLSRYASDLQKVRFTSVKMEEPTSHFRVDQLFEITKGDGTITKAYMRAHPGPHPVYSGSSFRDEVAGHIARYDYDGDHLTWAADGYAGPVFYRSGKFCANSHAGILRARPEYATHLYLPFFEQVLTSLFQDVAVGRFKPDGSPDYTRVTVSMARMVAVPLPVSEDGRPDFERQKRAADRLKGLHRLRDDLREELEKLVATDVVVGGLEP